MSVEGPRLASRLMWAQVLVVAIGAITPLIAAAVVAPRLFRMHLLQAGVPDSHVLVHAEAAFRSALGIAVTLGVVMSLFAAGIVSWFLVRRISSPIESLAEAAEELAAGRFDFTPDDRGFSREFVALNDSFAGMATQLQRSNESRVKMLADLAHELRTPLATLQAYIDGLEDGVIDPNQAAWTTMRAQVSRLHRLALDLRQVAAAEDPALGFALQRLDICDTVRTALAAARPRITEKQIELTYRESADPVWILGDELRLQQVLANLLDNGIRHTPRQGEISVDVSHKGGHAEVIVRDSGSGIPPGQLEAIFERFHRVDQARASQDGGGSGLGLTIARAIVQAHGGTLTARAGLGATFVIQIPTTASDLL